MDDEDVSVRVAVRIRPQIPREIIDMCQICTSVTPGEPQVTLGSDKAFTYNYVFDTHEAQDTVYETCVATLVDSSLEGYNATVLAYGQTGSGKTYTMGTGFDVEVTAEQVGIIPRAIHHLFDGIHNRIQTSKENGVLPPEFKVSAQFMELYNEEVIDLFNPTHVKGKGFKINEDPDGGIHVKGVTTKTVLSAEEALQCLRLGALSRTTASTQMNSQSSRSHAIFTLHIKQQRLVPNEEDEGNEFETLTAKFHFVDLAGSERLKRTGATGDRAKEGISINCGLLALGNVISALGDKAKRALHVPYRDSKLTRLLQDSLGGNSQTVMIACISPSDRDFMETLNTLKYANRARNIKNRITINQDKSSRTIVQLRQQIAQLQLELVEYKQGKRVLNEDGTETVNDMFYENNMLQSELNNLRTRVKAMQETIDTLTAKNAALLTEKATGSWIGDNQQGSVTDMVQSYLIEIQDLQAKLMESNSMCEQLRKQSNRLHDLSNVSSNLSNVSFGESPAILEEAKRVLEKEKELLEKVQRSEIMESDSGSESGEDSENDSSHEQLETELANLTTDIDMKQKLIEELELSQRRMQTMRQHYEEKLIQLQVRIKDTQEERDKVLQSYQGQITEPTEKVKKVRDEYERKLTDLQKELKRLQAAQKEHARLLRNQTQHESQLRSFKNELSDMKRAKVKLINKMKEESQRHKESENRRMREIAQLKKESRKNANMIRSMEAERRAKEIVLKRKQEEVSALRRHQRDNLSNRAAGRKAKPRGGVKAAKQKWVNVEKSINKLAMSKQVIVEQELRMEQLINKRESLGGELQKLRQKRVALKENGQDAGMFDSLIDDIMENINYVQETITETQHNVMEIEEAQEANESTDIQQIVQSVFDIDEARYLIQKLFNMTVNQSHVVAQKDAKIKEGEASLLELQQENSVKAQLLDHMLHTEQTMFLTNSMTASLSSNANDSSSNTSSRSASPLDNLLTAEIRENNKPNKIRKKTALPAELLFGVKNSGDLMTQSQDGTTLRQEHPIQRVPSAPGSLKGLLPLATRRASPRLIHRLPLSTSAKHGSMDQGLDLVSPSPPGSPVAYRRATSREDNVFNRLTAPVDSHQTSKGRIVPYNGKNPAKALLQCISIVEGHNNGVLSLCCTEDTLVTGAADRTVKIWDLVTGTEKHTLSPHPNNVVAVRYNPETNLLLSASSSYVKVWDVRQSSAKCIKVLCSSGLTQTASSLSATRSVQIALGESQINDVLFNKDGNVICTAASDKVRVWDVRKLCCIGKLSGGHQAAVMCMAVGRSSQNGSDLIVTGSKDHYIKVFDVDASTGGNFTPTMNLEPPHYDGIQSLVLRGSILFSGSRDMCIKKWDLDKSELCQSLNNAHKGWICGLALMNEAKLLVSGCRAGYLKMWDANTCDLHANMKAHNSAINAIASNSQFVMTASNCGEVKIWRLAMD